ncbi:MAG: hypothetical protein HOV94_42935, partial [Saccharothrix sp.]|nr:hypothetical protein [Saccharothrix sp.]
MSEQQRRRCGRHQVRQAIPPSPRVPPQPAGDRDGPRRGHAAPQPTAAVSPRLVDTVLRVLDAA